MFLKLKIYYHLFIIILCLLLNYALYFRFIGSTRVGNLLHMAGNLGKAVGTLVTVMTDDEDASGSDDDLKH